jgi:hypothetical protein
MYREGKRPKSEDAVNEDYLLPPCFIEKASFSPESFDKISFLS